MITTSRADFGRTGKAAAPGRFVVLLAIMGMAWGSGPALVRAQAVKDAPSEVASGPVVLEEVDLLGNERELRIPVRTLDGTRHFLLDTGADCSFIDGRYKKQLGRSVGIVETQDAAGNISKERVYKAPAMAVGKTPLKVKRIVVTKNLARSIMEMSGETYDGILGIGALRRHVIVLDFDRSRMLLCSRVPQEFTQGTEVPLTRSGRSYYLTAVINGRPVRCLLDTGCTDLSLSAVDTKQVFSGKQPATTHDYCMTASGEISKVHVFRVATVALGSTAATDILSSVLDENGESIIGCGVLRQFRVALDFPNGKMHLLSRKNPPEKEEMDMSGLFFTNQPAGITVMNVEPGSPAAEAGMKAGDVLIEIGGTKRDNLSLSDIDEYLCSQDGVRVEIKALRDGKTLDFVFRLRRLI